MTRRSGATLVEVLVTIFVMAIGLIALLTLFPIGALKMAEAIKDSRSALAAANAEALAIARNLRNDLLIVNPNTTPRRNLYEQPVRSNPPRATDSPIAPMDGPSYPVYMDPIGRRTYSGVPIDLQNWVGGERTANIGIPRVSAAFIRTSDPRLTVQDTLSSFSLPDDITFGPNGVPIDPMGNPTGSGSTNVQREGRYSWALLLKRPKTATPSVVDMTVVVYSGRPMQLSSGSAVPFGESVYDVRSGAEGTTTITLQLRTGQERPNIKKGTWILDATRETNSASLKRYGPVHGHFYRVVNYTELSPTLMQLQVERPLKADMDTSVPNGRTGRAIVMDNVVEVFEKGAGWLP